MQKQFLTLVTAVIMLAPTLTSAATWSSPFEISGWIPYWRSATGTAEAVAHIDVFKELNPFVYTLKKDGTLVDNGKLQEEPWISLRKMAKEKHIRFIPTIMSGDGDTIHALLSNTKARQRFEDAIAKEVKDKGYDGIDIDFEAKHAETKPYFSTFLKGLYQRLGTKWLQCTIESRTPLDSRYEGTPPADATQYANDYVAINKYCDRVRIMAYDQQTIDVKLNKDAMGNPYIPVADPRWVEKVVVLASKSIAKSKIVIGVPTYGYEYLVTPLTQGYRYDRLWAFNPQYGITTGLQYNTPPTRNSAGELSLQYFPYTNATTSAQALNVGPEIPISTEVMPMTVTTTGMPPATKMPFNILWWSDGQAIAQKVLLAKKLGVRGVAIFKIDGGGDPAMWPLLTALSR